MKVVRPGHFAKAGDLVRNGWCGEKRCIAPPYTHGIVIEVEHRSPKAYTTEQIAEKPVRLIRMLTDEGKMIQRYAVHIEVVG